MKLRALLLAIFAVALSPLAVSQTTPFGYTNSAFAPTGTLPNSPVRIVSSATIRVCTEPASGTPCTPLATIYSDSALTQVKSNSFQADTYGNYTFFVPAGTYHVQQSGPQVATTDIPYIQFGAGGGGGGAPCGTTFDVQINNPLGTFGCDTGIFQEFPSTHTMTDNILKAFLQLQVSDPTNTGLIDIGHSNGSTVDYHLQMSLASTFGASYGFDFPNGPPTGSNQVMATAAGSPGGDGRWLLQWVNSGSVGICGGLGTNPGDVCYYNGSAWVIFTGNAAGNKLFQESSSGVPSWVAPASLVCGVGSPWSASYFCGTPTSAGQYGSLQNAAFNYNNSSGAVAMSVTLPNPYRTGDALVFGGGTTGTITLSSLPTDTCGNTWTRVGGLDIWYATSAVACSTPDVITVTVATGTGNWISSAAEGWGSGVFDAASTGSTGCSGSNPTINSLNPVTTTAADALFVMAYAVGGAGAGYVSYDPGTINGTGQFDLSAPGQFAFISGGGFSASAMMEYGPAPTVGSNTATYGWNALSGGSFGCSSNVATLAFKPSVTNPPLAPAPTPVTLQALIDGGTFGAQAVGNSYVFNGYKQVSLQYSTGLNLSTTDGTSYILTATGVAPTIYLSGTDSGTSGTNYLLTSGNLNVNSNSCPASLTSGVTATIIPGHANSSTTPTFQLCGLGSPATIVKNGNSGQAALVNNDMLTNQTATLVWNASTSTWELRDPQQGGSISTGFSSLSSGTNMTAAMVVGAGASLDYTSTGTIDANKVNGATVPASKAFVGTNGSSQIVDASTTYASSSVFGIAKVDGTTVTSSGGVLSATLGSATQTVSVTDIAPVSADQILVIDPPVNITISRVICGTSAATSVVVDLKPASESAWGTLGSSILSGTITATPSGALGTIVSPSLTAHTPLMLSVGTVTGTVGQVYCAVEYN